MNALCTGFQLNFTLTCHVALLSSKNSKFSVFKVFSAFRLFVKFRPVALELKTRASVFGLTVSLKVQMKNTCRNKFGRARGATKEGPGGALLLARLYYVSNNCNKREHKRGRHPTMS